MQPFQAAVSKAVMSNGKTTKEEEEEEEAVGQVQEMTQSSRNYFPRPGDPRALWRTAFTRTAVITHPHQFCVSMNCWHSYRRTPTIRNPSQVRTILASRMRESLCISTTEKEFKQPQS
jgi:hypothetical protein